VPDLVLKAVTGNPMPAADRGRSALPGHRGL